MRNEVRGRAQRPRGHPSPLSNQVFRPKSLFEGREFPVAEDHLLPTPPLGPESPRSVLELLASKAASMGGSAALASQGRRPLTYGEIPGQVELTTEALRSRGLGRKARVALVAQGGPEAAMGFLGLASSACCAPLNPGYQKPEYLLYLSSLGADALVVETGTGGGAREAARELGLPVFELKPEGRSGLFRLSALEGPEGPPSSDGPPGGEDAALVLHTSGTTSRPKVVPLTHRNLLASASSIARSLGLTPDDRCLSLMPLFHVHGLMASLLASLSAGAEVVLTPGFHPESFFAWLEEFKPTWYTAVPTMHRALLDKAAGRRKPAGSGSLRFIRSCSAPLAPTLMREMEEVFGVPVVEAYGMTEASHQISSNPLPPGKRKPGSVGVPTGCQIEVMGPKGELLPPGRTGEVVIRGGSVTAGYEGEPEAGGSAFADGWFRTGDEGYLDAEGYLYLTGRLKEMINRAGEKISPREVEDVLVAHPQVSQAVAFAAAHPSLFEEVAAAVVVRRGAALREEELRLFAARRLAPFKVPRRVLFMEELPRGPTGKLRRKGMAETLGLRAEDLERDDGINRGHAPLEGELEKRLAEIWSAVLGLQVSGAEEDFFRLGGTSLQAAHLTAEINRELGSRMPVSYLYVAPTVRKLARALAAALVDREAPALFPLKPSGSRAPLFLAHPHTGHLLTYGRFLAHLGGEQPVYGLHSPDPEGRGDRPGSLEELVSSYVEEIIGFLPEGPYCIGGHCSGSAVAFEIARQLTEKGREVAYLALIDGYAPGYPKPREGSSALAALTGCASDYLHRLRSFLQYVSCLAPRQRAEHLLHLLPNLSKDVARATLKRMGRTLPRGLQLEAGSLRGLLAGYRPSPFPGRAVIFKPSLEPAGYIRDPYMGWGGLVEGGLEVVEVPGYHRTLIFDPRCRTLARLLTQSLEAAQLERARP